MDQSIGQSIDRSINQYQHYLSSLPWYLTLWMLQWQSLGWNWHWAVLHMKKKRNITYQEQHKILSCTTVSNNCHSNLWSWSLFQINMKISNGTTWYIFHERFTFYFQSNKSKTLNIAQSRCYKIISQLFLFTITYLHEEAKEAPQQYHEAPQFHNGILCVKCRIRKQNKTNISM